VAEALGLLLGVIEGVIEIVGVIEGVIEIVGVIEGVGVGVIHNLVSFFAVWV